MTSTICGQPQFEWLKEDTKPFMLQHDVGDSRNILAWEGV